MRARHGILGGYVDPRLSWGDYLSTPVEIKAVAGILHGYLVAAYTPDSVPPSLEKTGKEFPLPSTL